MKKVLITGVTGQTGSYMVEHLLKTTDHNIVGVVRRLSVSNHENINHISDPRFRLEFAEVTDKSSIQSLIKKEKPDYFINFAANSFVGNSWNMPYSHMDTNFMGVLHQLEAIKDFCPNCRYYNAGSSEEFGNVEYSPQDEKHPQNPRSPYGVSKSAARLLVKVYRESYNLYAIQGHLFNHESPRRGVEFVSRKIAMGVARIKNAIDNKKPFQPIELGNLNASRDWSHAADFVDGIWRMLNQEKHRSTTKMLGGGHSRLWLDDGGNKTWLKEYVLASNQTHTVRNFVEKAFQVAGIYGAWQLAFLEQDETFVNKDSTLVKINPEFYRPAEVELLYGDASLAKEELNWSPNYTFNSLVEEMANEELCKIAKK